MRVIKDSKKASGRKKILRDDNQCSRFRRNGEWVDRKKENGQEVILVQVM